MPFTPYLETIFSAIDEGFCLCEIVRDDDDRAVDYRFIEVNPRFEEMTGLKGARGRTALDLVPDLEPYWVETYARVADGEIIRFESGSDVMGRYFDVFATPVLPAGRFVLVFRDITEQRRTEAEREAARKQAEQLLNELNHRVMNSLAMITSIVRMEGQLLDSGSPAAETVGRLMTRLAAVTNLYRALNQAASAAEVPASEYLEAVARSVAEAITDHERVEVVCDFLPVMLPSEQAAPLGLLLNELMTNAVKHGFGLDDSGRIHGRLARHGDLLRLTVHDECDGTRKGTGNGSAAAFAQPGGSGMGAELIEAFADQLGGTVERTCGPSGTAVAITFPSLPPASRSAC